MTVMTTAMTSVTLLQGISIEGNRESKLGKVLLYATNNYVMKRERFDSVVLLMTDDDGRQYYQCAQLLVLLRVDTFDQQQTTYRAIVRYLQSAKPIKATGSRRAVSQHPPPRV